MMDPTGKLSSADGDLMTEEEFLQAYQVRDYPRPSVTVDICIFTVVEEHLKILLIKRGGHPHKGKWALPGGFVDVGDAVKNQGEDLEAAAHRELEEETHLPRGSCYLEQLYTFGKAGRDPRTRVISVAYYALVRPDLVHLVSAGDDASEAAWFNVDEVPEFAFDHEEIFTKALERLREKIDYIAIAFGLVPESFTINDIRAVYQAVKGGTYEAKTFYRKFRRMVHDDIITIGDEKRPTATRPATSYRFNRT